jgi:hypothetical protein
MSAKEVRNSIGGDVLIAMAANEEFPISNRGRLAKTMQEYFKSEGFEDVLVELGYSWRPDADYWVRHLSDAREYLRREKKLFLEFKRENSDGTFTGAWAFMRKGDFAKVMAKEREGLSTRSDTYNERNDGGNDKWPSLESPSVRLALIGKQ